jgi:hypothetical protein
MNRKLNLGLSIAAGLLGGELACSGWKRFAARNFVAPAANRCGSTPGRERIWKAGGHQTILLFRVLV